jgi:hypothetical protein
MSTFDPNSPKAKRGMAFQKRIQAELAQLFPVVVDVREWLKKNDPSMSHNDLNQWEQKLGDIIIKLNDSVFFVECVSVGPDSSPFPESKIKKFVGSNKWYAFGWDGYSTKFIHERTWNAYAKKLPEIQVNGRDYRELMRWNIENINKAQLGTTKFYEYLNEKR